MDDVGDDERLDDPFGEDWDEHYARFLHHLDEPLGEHWDEYFAQYVQHQVSITKYSYIHHEANTSLGRAGA